MTTFLQRKIRQVFTELAVKLLVHLILGNPKRKFRGFSRKVFNFDAVEMGERDAAGSESERAFVQQPLALENAYFQFTQSTIGDDQEIAGTAGGVKYPDVVDTV